MKKLLVLPVFVLCLFVSRAYSQDRWIYMVSTADYAIYFDKETIKFIGNEISVNLKYICDINSKKYQDADNIISKHIYYCGNDKFQLVSIVIYYRNGSKESKTFNRYEDIVPESEGEYFYNFFCK